MLVSDSKGRRAPIFSGPSHEPAPAAGSFPLLLHSMSVGCGNRDI